MGLAVPLVAVTHGTVVVIEQFGAQGLLSARRGSEGRDQQQQQGEMAHGMNVVAEMKGIDSNNDGGTANGDCRPASLPGLMMINLALFMPEQDAGIFGHGIILAALTCRMTDAVVSLRVASSPVAPV